MQRIFSWYYRLRIRLLTWFHLRPLDQNDRVNKGFLCILKSITLQCWFTYIAVPCLGFWSQRCNRVPVYHPLGNPLKEVISVSWDLLSRSCGMRTLHQAEVVNGYRHNLKDLLVSSSIRPHNNTHLCDTTNKCTSTRCRYCPRLNKSGNIVSTSPGKSFSCKQHFSCKLHNLIYCITCNKCTLCGKNQQKTYGSAPRTL